MNETTDQFNPDNLIEGSWLYELCQVLFADEATAEDAGGVR